MYFDDSNASIVSNEPDNEEPDLASSKSYRRRSSAHAKAERKKADTQMNYSSSNDISSIDTDQIKAYYQQRQKRHSWWNIFTNEPRRNDR